MSSETTLNLHQRLNAVMKEVTYVRKEKKQGMQYSIVSHDAVTAKVRPAMVKHGVIYYPVDLSHSQNGNRTEVALSLRFVNIDEPGDFIDVACLGHGVGNDDKNPGKAISYCVKYGLLKALGLETGEDPDLDQAAEHIDDAETERLAALNAAINLHRDSITVICEGIDTGDLSAAAEAWFEMTDDEKQSLWVAPSKGGPFTTEHRRMMKTTEFRVAHYGEDTA